jgi:hypothetical protein
VGHLANAKGTAGQPANPERLSRRQERSCAAIGMLE